MQIGHDHKQENIKDFCAFLGKHWPNIGEMGKGIKSNYPKDDMSNKVKKGKFFHEVSFFLQR